MLVEWSIYGDTTVDSRNLDFRYRSFIYARPYECNSQKLWQLYMSSSIFLTIESANSQFKLPAAAGTKIITIQNFGTLVTDKLSSSYDTHSQISLTVADSTIPCQNFLHYFSMHQHFIILLNISFAESTRRHSQRLRKWLLSMFSLKQLWYKFKLPILRTWFTKKLPALLPNIRMYMITVSEFQNINLADNRRCYNRHLR